ncbi:MAG: helix-turn-helix domain-containing protein [Candidatus Promineifilaceae bacterium]|nr:helix-turn-helix domain-containing protein [Candidatus Promineifilaceae bacterium]
MSRYGQSVREGSSQIRSLDLGNFQVTNITFPASLTLPSHYHRRACFAVVLEGSVEKVFARASHTTVAGSVVTMPPEERHTDHFEAAGANMLVVEPLDGDRVERLLRPCAGVFNGVNHYRGSGMMGMAWRIYHELNDPDALSPLAVSGLVLEMLARAARGQRERSAESRPPAWLGQAREYLHANFNGSFLIADVAEAVGVHPVHLARTFRQHYGVSPSTYLRRLRLDWVAARLVRSDEQLSLLARRAGFADQSHLTRLFKRQTGLTPGQYRDVVRSR